MSVDPHIREKKIGHGSLLHPLTVVFAGMTLLFCVLSIVSGNHLSALYVEQLKAMEKSETLDSESVDQMQTALKNAQANLEAIKKEAVAEKKNAKHLSQQLSVTQKELLKVKADLNIANQAIDALKTTQPVKSATDVDASSLETLPTKNMGLSTQPSLPRENTPAVQPPSQAKDQVLETALPDQPPADIPSDKPSSAIAPLTDAVDQKNAPGVPSGTDESASGPPPQSSVETDGAQ